VVLRSRLRRRRLSKLTVANSTHPSTQPSRGHLDLARCCMAAWATHRHAISRNLPHTLGGLAARRSHTSALLVSNVGQRRLVKF
jgi:hypothetical protein